MLNLVKGERLKLRHTFGAWLPLLAPVFALCLVLSWASVLGSAMFAGVWNWWYTLLLPGMLAILCSLEISKDKRNGYFNLLLVPVPAAKCLLGKIIHASLCLAAANFVIFAGTWICGALSGWRAPVLGGFCAFLVLSITYLWEIPLYFFLAARFHMFAVVSVSMILQFFSVPFFAGSAYWWVFPAAIPVRLMCPVLGILPNGLMVPENSSLWDGSVLMPGILLSLAWLLLTGLLTLAWFNRKVVRE